MLFFLVGTPDGGSGRAASRECVRTRIMAWRSTRDKRYRRAPVSRYASRTRGPSRAIRFTSVGFFLSLSLSCFLQPTRNEAIGSRVVGHGSITVVKSARGDIAHVHCLIPRYIRGMQIYISYRYMHPIMRVRRWARV